MLKYKLLLLICILVLTVFPLKLSEFVVNPKKAQWGIASFYHNSLHGEITANGELYSKNALTAAHRFLPFDTVVLVENLENGKSVIVRITDRGPFIDNRIIDLSYEGARKLDFVTQGLAKVRLVVLH